jgi:hypothetical protein
VLFLFVEIYAAKIGLFLLITLKKCIFIVLMLVLCVCNEKKVLCLPLYMSVDLLIFRKNLMKKVTKTFGGIAEKLYLCTAIEKKTHS